MLGDEVLTISFWSLGHMLGSYGAMLLLLRHQGFRPRVGVFMAFGYATAGFSMVLGAAWYYMLPSTVLFPLLLWQWLRLPSLPAKRL